PTAKPLPIAASFAPLTASLTVLRPGMSEKRFFGAGGTLSLPLEAQPGMRLVVAGATASMIGADGRVREGSVIPLTGPGRVTLHHPPGLVAAWIEAEGVSPWSAGMPQAVTFPAQLPLAGETMALALPVSTPVLLHARTTAPVAVILRHGDSEEAPTLF